MLLNQAFGQQIRLDVYERYDGYGSPIFWSDSLRIDFEYNTLGTYERATIKVYNLSPEGRERIGKIDNFAAITVIHHGIPKVLFTNFIIKNAHTETRVPSSITTLYCAGHTSTATASIVGNITKESIAAQPGGILTRGYLLNHILLGRHNAKNTGGVNEEQATKIQYELVDFPKDYFDSQVRSNGGMAFSRSLIEELQRFARQFSYTINVGSKIRLIYDASIGTVTDRAIEDAIRKPAGQLKLKIRDMKTNPRISTAEIVLNVLLDTSIRNGMIIDTKDLFSKVVGETDETLQAARDFLLSTVKAISKYRVLGVVHKGSNYTQEWDTRVHAYPPGRSITDTKGKK